MAILKSKDIHKMTKEERDQKLKELHVELIKSKVANKKNGKLNTQLIKRTIAKLLTVNNKKTEEKK